MNVPSPVALASSFSVDGSRWLRSCAPGVMFSLTIGMAAQFISNTHGGPTMLFALLLGMALHFASDEVRFVEGVAFSAKSILRVGVALLGARITADQILGLGLPVMAGVTATVALTIGFGVVVARLLGMKSRFGVLSAGAVAICGASAAAAISAVLPRYATHERDTAFTILGVTTLSTIAMVSYPLLARTFGLDGTQTGIFLGGTIHDVAQVVGAGFSVSTEAGEVATIIKLLRVTLLVPVVLLIAFFGRRIDRRAASGRPALLPGFLLAFLAIVAMNSFGAIPAGVQEGMSTLSRWCILTAIAALGMKTSLASMASIGHRAIALVLAETVFIAAIVFVLLMSI